MLCWSCDRIMCIVRIGSLSGLLVENSALIFLVFMLVSAYSCLFLVNLLGIFFQQVLKGVVKDRLEPNWMSFSPLCSQHNLKRKLKINFSLYTEICPVTWFVCVRVSEWVKERERKWIVWLSSKKHDRILKWMEFFQKYLIQPAVQHIYHPYCYQWFIGHWPFFTWRILVPGNLFKSHL